MRAMAEKSLSNPIAAALLEVVAHARNLEGRLSESNDIRRRALAWLGGLDTGLSSQTMCITLLGGISARKRHPQDSADLGRCLRLLELVPEWRGRLGELAALSLEWAALVGAWDEIEALYREEIPTGGTPRCSKRMRELLRKARVLAW